MTYFAKYNKQAELEGVLADVELKIRLHQAPDEGVAPPKPKRARRAAAAVACGDAADPLQLASFPAHRMILNASEYFAAQGVRWQGEAQPPATPAAGRGSRGASSSSAANAKWPAVHLTIDSAEQLPAAEAVIAAMYGVPDAISSLEQQQLVHALVIADMVHAEAAGRTALQVLQAAAQSDAGLPPEALAALAALPVWPACLLQLLPRIVESAPCCRDSGADLAAVLAADAGGRIQRMLIGAFGGLQAVWSDIQQTALLLGLPLPAMQLLLSSDQLRVPSEDTVLYTAKRYVQAQGNAAAKAAAKAALVQLVRAPQLSLFALRCAALPADSSQQLLGIHAQQLRELLSLKSIATAEELMTAMQRFEGVPASWLLGPRQIVPRVDGVLLEWRLPVQQLAQACRDSFTQQESVFLNSDGSAPMGGVSWRMRVKCHQQEDGSVVGLYAGPVVGEVPESIFRKFRFTALWQGEQATTCTPCMRGMTWGWPNYFDLQPMAGGGWDEAVWAAKGLPTSGEMVLQLHMHSVE